MYAKKWPVFTCDFLLPNYIKLQTSKEKTLATHWYIIGRKKLSP
jgi:hypothetical protein